MKFASRFSKQSHSSSCSWRYSILVFLFALVLAYLSVSSFWWWTYTQPVKSKSKKRQLPSHAEHGDKRAGHADDRRVADAPAPQPTPEQPSFSSSIPAIDPLKWLAQAGVRIGLPEGPVFQVGSREEEEEAAEEGDAGDGDDEEDDEEEGEGETGSGNATSDASSASRDGQAAAPSLTTPSPGTSSSPADAPPAAQAQLPASTGQQQQKQEPNVSSVDNATPPSAAGAVRPAVVPPTQLNGAQEQPSIVTNATDDIGATPDSAPTQAADDNVSHQPVLEPAAQPAPPAPAAPAEPQPQEQPPVSLPVDAPPAAPTEPESEQEAPTPHCIQPDNYAALADVRQQYKTRIADAAKGASGAGGSLRGGASGAAAPAGGVHNENLQQWLRSPPQGLQQGQPPGPPKASFDPKGWCSARLSHAGSLSALGYDLVALGISELTTTDEDRASSTTTTSSDSGKGSTGSQLSAKTPWLGHVPPPVRFPTADLSGYDTWSPTLAPSIADLGLPEWGAMKVMEAEGRRKSRGDFVFPPGMTQYDHGKDKASQVHDASCALHIMSITNDYYTYTCEMIRSAVLNGLVPHVVGFVGPAVDKDSLFNWGLGKPLLWLRPAIAALAASLGPHTMVMIADAHDVLVTATGSNVIARFRYLQTQRPGMRVLVTAERSCFPISEAECAQFPKPDLPCTQHNRNLNSGGWMGEAQDVLAVLDAVDAAYPDGLVAATMNDQAALQYLYLNATTRRKYGLQLDYSSQVFQAMHMSEQEVSQVDVDGAPWRWCNTATGGCPAILHYNGGSKGMQVPMDATLATTKATLGPTKRADAVAWLDSYMIGGVNQMVREFCCDPRWTNTEFNKVRSEWLGC